MTCGGKAAVFVVSFLMAVSVAWADAQELFEQGNRAYQAGDFPGARDHYERLVAVGHGGLALSYNLGNTYYRLGQMGPARLWYERALAAAPGDDDARFNRDRVAERVGEKNISSDLGSRFVDSFWLLATVANFSFFGLLIWGLFRESEWIWWGRWTTGVLGLLIFFAALAAQRQAAVPYGVIVTARAEARVGPSVQERVGFVAPEGHRVVLLDTLNEWIQIGVPSQGLKGWVPHETVEPLRR